MQIQKFANNDERSIYLSNSLKKAMSTTDKRLSIALSGGSTPLPFFRFMAHHNLTTLSQGASIYWVDERVVPADDSRNNASVAIDTWLQYEPNVDIHRIDTSLPAHLSALAYHKILRRKNIDTVLLGMGTDGHIASIFPQEEQKATKCFSTYNANDSTWRVSMSLAQISKCSKIYLLVSGSEKLKVLQDTERFLPVHQLCSIATVSVLYCE